MINDVLSFSMEYLNSKKERTFARKKKIRAAYRELFGKEMQGFCSTCYIEAMLEIVKSFKQLNVTNMAARNYELKRGVLLQELGYPEKACTNDTLTDELAEWHLGRHPEKSILFARVPSPQPAFIPPPEIHIIQPAKTIESDIVDTLLNTAGIQAEPEKKSQELKKKGSKKPNTRK